MIIIKKIIILFIICIILITGCGKKQDGNSVDISSNEYKKIIDTILTNSMAGNDNYEYRGYRTHTPYLEVSIYPKKELGESESEQAAEKIVKEILYNLKNYRFVSGGIFKYNYEYINLYFYGKKSGEKLSRNGGPFAQISILELEKATIDSVMW